MSESVSLPPSSVAGVPKKSSAMLYGGIAGGVLVLAGAIGAIVIVASSKEGGSSVATPVSASAIASASPPPPPPPQPDPIPATSPTDDAGATATGDDDALADAGPAPAETATAQATAQNNNASAPPVPPPTPKGKDPAPPSDPNAWNEPAARSRLSQANGILVFCKKPGGVTGPGTANVTFNTDGTVGAVVMDPPYAGTPAGDCVVGHFKRTKVNAFHGAPQTLKHSFEVPK